MSADARSEILARIRAALQAPTLDQKHSGPSGPGAVGYSRPTSDDVRNTDALCARFLQELALVDGDTIITENGEDAIARTVADLIASRGFHRIAVHSNPLAVRAAIHIDSSRIVESSVTSAAQLETVDCAILGAEALIAETGSAVVRLDSYAERLFAYLPPACIIVAHAATVREHFDALSFSATDDERGERVIITGPSRTADIEKTIVLGAHGPATLTVVIANR